MSSCARSAPSPPPTATGWPSACGSWRPRASTRRWTPPAAGELPALVELTGGPEHVVTIADYTGAQEPAGHVQRRARGAGARSTRSGEIGELIEGGSFALPVQETFPLEQIAEAHRLSENGHVRGKLVLLVD